MKSNKVIVIGLFLTVCLVSVTIDGAAQEKKGGNPMVEVKTNLGKFTIELYKKEAPITVENFLNYVDKKYYDGTIFHRVIPEFVIQGGGFTPEMMKKATAPPIENEATNGLKNLKYTLSMARTTVVNSATSQFFVNLKDNPPLDHKSTAVNEFGYAVFGKVIEGTEVIDKIAAVKTTTKGSYANVPVKPIVMKTVRRIDIEKKGEKEKAKEKKE
jgi:cyclophilin family peptidyl-prolyl cis-trans isomerase